MGIPAVATAIRDRLGLEPDSLGAAALLEAVNRRMRECRVTTADAYLGVLATAPGELDRLAAELAVPETWFFRGSRLLFDRLAEFALARLATRPHSRGVRILSIPCSTGEEPYSLAIALHEHAVPPERAPIDAVDVSARHLERAVAAQYTAFSFREIGPDIRLSHFRRVGDRWELLPHVRERVRFRMANLADPAFLFGEPPYDLVICRNVFIYLTPSARLRAMENLDRLLAEDGILCLTPGEADRLPPGRFVPVGGGEFGIYQRAHREPGNEPFAQQGCKADEARRERSELPTYKPMSSRIVPPAPRPLPPVVEVPPPPAPPMDEPKPAPPAANPLDAVRELADAGKLAEARAACERVIRGGGPSAPAYALLGVIQQAEGKADEAAESFRRALYLDPDDVEAISHMIVSCDRKGNATQAAALRRRLAKLTGKET